MFFGTLRISRLLQHDTNVVAVRSEGKYALRILRICTHAADLFAYFGICGNCTLIFKRVYIPYP